MTITYRALGNEGRCGNQLHQIAATLGIADMLGEPVIFPRWDYENIFSVPSEFFGDVPKDAIDATDTAPALAIPEQHRPYLQSLELWADISERIRRWFTPRPEVVEEVERWCADLGVDPTKSTSVHVRRTDAVIKQRWFNLPDMAYFTPAMKLIASEGPTTFLVVSDDVVWCAVNFPEFVNGNRIECFSPVLPEAKRNFRGDPLGNEAEIRDFVLQYLCAHHITCNSTYSWWAAWLSGDPSPITPAKWFGPAYEHTIDLDKFLPSSWRRL